MNGDSFWLTYKLAKYASSQWINHLTTPDTNATIFYEALQHFLAISVAKQVRGFRVKVPCERLRGLGKVPCNQVRGIREDSLQPDQRV